MFKKASRKFANLFDNLVSESKSILITAHKSQDDDSIASVISIFNYISQKFPEKLIEMVYPGEPLPRYETFYNYHNIKFVEDITDYISEKELLIFLDGSQYDRFTHFPEKIQKFSGKTICIDHHSSPIDKFTLTLVDPTISSNAENIYDLFYKNKILNLNEIEPILLGILGDTGMFSYLKPNQIKTFDVAKRLIKEGNIYLQEFISRYSSISIKAFEIIQELLKNTQNYRIANWPPFTYSYISREWFEKGNYTDDQRSEATHLYMSNYLRLIEGHKWGFILSPKVDGNYSVSFRSLPGSINVRILAEKMAIGGGHNRAAGGTFKSNLPLTKIEVEKCFDQIVNFMNSSEPILD